MRPRSASASACSALLALVLACGSGKPSTEPPVPPPGPGPGAAPIALADFSAAYAAAVCTVKASCHAWAAYREQDCEAELTGFQSTGDLQKGVAAGRLRYDAAQARTCVDGIAARDCSDRASEATDAACRAAVKGTLAVGAACNWINECGAGLCAPALGGTCPATCPAVLVEGQTCPSGNLQCDEKAGLRCIASVCRRPGAAGASCQSVSDCRPGLGCTNRVCANPSAEGGPCGGGEGCMAGLYCLNGTPDIAGTCRRQAAVGSPCGEDAAHEEAASIGVQCALGLVCKGFAPSSGGLPGTPGSCTRAAGPGQDCNEPTAANHFGASGCQERLVCAAIAGTTACRVPPSSGPCLPGDVCSKDSYCDSAKQCRPLLAVGATCTSDQQCDSGACGSDGKCAAVPGLCHEP